MGVTTLTLSQAWPAPPFQGRWTRPVPLTLSIFALLRLGSWQMWHRLSGVYLGWKSSFLLMSKQFRALSPQGQLLFCLGQINSAGLILTHPPVPTPPLASIQWVAASLGISWDFAECPWTKGWQQVWTCINLKNTTSPFLVTHRTYLMQFMYHQRFFHWLNLIVKWQLKAGGGRTQGALGICWPALRSGASKSQCWCAVWSFSCTPRHRRGNH